ncbi:MAG: GAF domain-containing protein, partial [Spirochaetes bacterium]|nr:GAF domain-containing protein [Spirochaetota bacterium]
MRYFPQYTTVFNRSAVLCATLSWTGILHFSVVFPGNIYQLRSRKWLWLWGPAVAIAAAGISTDLIVRKAEFISGKLVRDVGPLYKLYAGYMAAIFVAFFPNIVYKFRKFKNPYIQLQLRYETFAIGVGVTIAAFSGVILPALGINDFYVSGSALGVTSACGFFYYATQAGQLMDFSAFSRFLIFYLIFAILLITPAILGITILFPYAGTWPESVRVFAIIAGMAAFTGYSRLLHHVMLGFIQRREKEMRLRVERFASELENTADKRDMAKRTVAFLTELMKLEHAEFFVFQEDSRAFDLTAASDPDDLAQQISTNETLEKHSHDWLFKIFLLGEDLIYRDTLTDRKASGASALETTDLDFIGEFMRDGRFYVLIGLKFNNRLLGFLALGRKTERRAFTPAELKLLHLLRHDLSIALSNALMYSSLLEKVNEMNTLNRLAIDNQDKHTRESVIEMVCEVLSSRLPFERISFLSVEFVEQALKMSYSTSKNLFMPALTKRMLIKLGDGPVGAMVARKSEICVNYLFRVPKEERSEIERWLECSCYAMIPISHSGVPVGVLLLENFDQKSEIRRETMRYLSLLAQHIGSLLENFEMYHDIKEQVASLKIVTEAAFAMSGSLDIEGVTREVLQIIKRTFGFDHAGVFFYNSGHDLLHKGIAIAQSPRDEKLFSRLKFRGSDPGNPYQQALRDKEVVVFDDVRKIRHKIIRNASERWGRGMAIFPITVRHAAVAVLVLSYDPRRMKMSQDFQSVMGSLTRFYATALENARSFKKVETINENLEKAVEDRTREAVSERQKSDALLLNILPKEIASDLKAQGESKPAYYADVTVFFTDFVGFTQIAERLTAQELVAELNRCFLAFDDICEKYNIEKIKTIGDSYMAAGGLPLANETHAHDVVAAALEIQDFMR